MKRATGFVVIALALAATMSLTTMAVAQNSKDRSAAFEAAPKLATSVAGVHAFTAPPKDFNPLTATNRELWKYGLPEAPDKTADPEGFAHWQRAMKALGTHATDVRQTNYIVGPMKAAGQPQKQSSGTNYAYSLNWSGLAYWNGLSTWSSKKSFYQVSSVATVPYGNPPSDYVCSDGPWIVVAWNGIDGFTNGDVVQGGSFGGFECGEEGGYLYAGWVEWFPSYPVLFIYCATPFGFELCPVNPGDDFYTITTARPGTEEQYVFDEDLTTGWWGTFGLTYITVPGVAGQSGEWIVERPGGDPEDPYYLYPLADYSADSFYYDYALNEAGTTFDSTSSGGWNITMLADDLKTPISYAVPTAERSSIFFYDENCAKVRGCSF